MEAIKKEAIEGESLKAVPTPELKSIQIKYHPKIKFLVKNDEEVKEETPKNPETRQMSTLDLIEAVLKYVAPGPHGEQSGVKGYEQHKIFKVLDKIEDLPKDAKELQVKDKEFDLIKKKAKSFPWGTVDRFFLQFEESLGIVYDDKDVEK